jgi:methionine-rich copper-binding protein CopC
VLSASPSQVSITFTQDVQRITGTYGIDVTGPGGTSATAGAAVLNDEDRSIMTVALAPDLASGRYVVRWRNVSDEDGDAASGAFSFYIGIQPTAADLAADAALEDVGQDETPEVSPTTASQATPALSPTRAPPSAEGNDDDGGNAVAVTVAVVAVIAGLAVGFFGVRWFRRRRA